MKRNLNVPVIDILTGKPIEIPVFTGEGENRKQAGSKSLMLYNVVTTALTGDDMSSQERKTVDDETKLERWALAKRIVESEKQEYEVELSSEEIVKIKARVKTWYGTLVVGWVFDYLEK